MTPLLHVRPINFCVGPDIADHVSADPVAGCKLVKDTPASRGGADCSNIILGQFRVPIAGSAYPLGETVKASVSNGISHILSPRSPSQIVRPVVRAAPVSVSNVVSAYWGWAVERLADKAMNLGSLLLTRNLQPNHWVAVASAKMGLSDHPRFRVPDAPLTRRLIFGAGRYWLPFFRHSKGSKLMAKDSGKYNVKSTDKIAGYAVDFQAALIAGGWK